MKYLFVFIVFISVAASTYCTQPLQIIPKPSEIEYQNGTVVRLGEIYGVETPVNRFVYNCILPMELKARS